MNRSILARGGRHRAAVSGVAPAGTASWRTSGHAAKTAPPMTTPLTMTPGSAMYIFSVNVLTRTLFVQSVFWLSLFGTFFCKTKELLVEVFCFVPFGPSKKKNDPTLLDSPLLYKYAYMLQGVHPERVHQSVAVVS